MSSGSKGLSLRVPNELGNKYMQEVGKRMQDSEIRRKQMGKRARCARGTLLVIKAGLAYLSYREFFDQLEVLATIKASCGFWAAL